MGARFTRSIVVLLVATCLCQTQARAVKNDLSPLQRAIDLSSTDPKAAQRKLLALSSPSAKAFLAYLYMSHAVMVPNATKKVDALMNAAISKVSDASGLGDIKTGQHYHYADMDMLLTHLRFITDSDGGTTIPSSIFEKYPAQAFKAFAPYWGSTRDGFLRVDLQTRDDIKIIPAVAAFLGTLERMCGDPSSDCSGTIRYRFYRLQELGYLEASLAPQLFVETVQQSDNETRYLQLEVFLQTWANEELWNNQTYQKLTRQSKAAELPLAGFYRQRFKLSQAKSVDCAKAALAGMRMAYLDNYSSSFVDDARGTIAYPIFSTHALSLTDMQRQLGDKAMSNTDLAQALRLAILNGAEMEVIDWLIAHGAPLSGGKEPPLFTAVLRPQVVGALLKAGADVNETNAIGKTALIQAAQFNAADTMKLLIASGAQVKHAMVAKDSKEASDANSSCDFNYEIGGRTALMYAAAFSDYAAIVQLVKTGAEKSAVDSQGARALKYLSWNKKLSKEERAELVQTLSH